MLPNFEGLCNLRNLRMQHNEIAAFEPSMTALVQLKEIDLSQESLNCRAKHRSDARIVQVDSHLLQNLIKFVPAYITAIPVLAKCNLEGNAVQHVETGSAFTPTHAADIVTGWYEMWPQNVNQSFLSCWQAKSQSFRRAACAATIASIKYIKQEVIRPLHY